MGQFIEDSLKSEATNDTLYVLFSDHLSNRNTVYDTLEAHQDKRRLMFMAWGGGLEPETIDAPLTHFDVAPTIFDWAGIPNYHNHNWGRSVASGRSGLWYAGDESTRDVASEVSYIYDKGGYDNVSITLGPVEITVGDNVYKATYAGDVLRHRIYVLLFDEGGDVESIGFYGSKKYLDQAKVDNWFIAVSGTPAIGHFTDEEAQSHKDGALYYYMGRVGSQNPVTGVIEETLEISAEELEAMITVSKQE